jgi:hypothetical protein
MRTPAEIYAGSDGTETSKLYVALGEHGNRGAIALNLFRASKCSERAKVYRGGIRGKGISYRQAAYQRKQWSMGLVAIILGRHAEEEQIRWGWKEDPSVPFANESSWVLYVDLPQGQVSFHSPTRGDGPDYPGEWDKSHLSADRIIAFCDEILKQRLSL